MLERCCFRLIYTDLAFLRGVLIVAQCANILADLFEAVRSEGA
jgi:hypothetical protein